MKRSIVVLYLLTFLLSAILTGCSNSTSLQDAMADYSKIIAGTLPEDIKLTIYYLDPNILTRRPLSKDDLMNFSGVKIITIGSNKLAPYWELLKSLKPSTLKPVQDESSINARVYYVLEVGSFGEVLEVIISDIHGSIFVNGIAVEDHPLFYELIIHFLEDEGCEIPGI